MTNKVKKNLIIRSAPLSVLEEAISYFQGQKQSVSFLCQASFVSVVREKNSKQNIWLLKEGEINHKSVDYDSLNEIRAERFNAVVILCSNDMLKGYENILQLVKLLCPHEVILWASPKHQKKIKTTYLSRYLMRTRVKNVIAHIRAILVAWFVFLHELPDRFLFAFFTVCSRFVLFRIKNLLMCADNILVLPIYGFGRTIHDPDMMRRVFKGKRNVCIVFERIYTNPVSSLLWPDIVVVYLPFRLRIRLFGRTYEWCSSIGRRLKWLVGWREALIGRLKKMNTGVISLDDLLMHVQQVNDIGPLLVDVDPRKRGLKGPGFAWFAGWTSLVNNVSVSKAELPLGLCNHMRKKIRNYIKHTRNDELKLCCLYLREKDLQKKAGINEFSTMRRNASSFEDYIPAIQYLIKQGFIVLLTGDKAIPKKYRARDIFYSRLICAEWLHVDERFFSLFAGTSSNVWIGSCGGGYALAATSGIPALVLGVFPWGVGLPNAWLHYKHAKNAEGEYVLYQELFKSHAFDFEMKGYSLCELGAQEILSAVKKFHEEAIEGKKNTFADNVLEQLPEYALAKHTNSRLSQAWLDVYLRPTDGKADIKI